MRDPASNAPSRRWVKFSQLSSSFFARGLLQWDHIMILDCSSLRARPSLRAVLVMFVALLGAGSSRAQATPDWLWELSAHQLKIEDLIYAPDGQTVFSSSYDGQIRQWNVQSGALVRRFWVEIDWLHEMALSDDGAYIAGYGEGDILRVFDVSTGATICSFPLFGTCHGLQFIPGSRNLLYTKSGLLYEFDPILAQVVRTNPCPPVVYELEVSSSANVIALRVSSGVQLYDLTTRTLLRTLTNPSGYSNQATDISPNGSLVAVSYWPNDVSVFDTQTGSVVTSIDTADQGDVVPRFTVLSDYLNVHAPSGRRLIAYRTADWAKTLDTDLQDGIYILAQSPGGSGVAVSHGSYVRTYEWPTLSSVADFGQVLGRLIRWASQRDDSQYATGHSSPHANSHSYPYYPLANVWHADTGEWLQSFPGADSGDVYAIDYSPDGTKLAIASKYIPNDIIRLRIIDVATGSHTLNVSTGHTYRVDDLRYSPDGTRIATVGIDNLVKVWDSETGLLLATLTGHTAGVNRCFFRGNGELITVSRLRGDFGGGREVIHWDVTTRLPIRTWTFTANIDACYVEATDRLFVQVGFGGSCREIAVSTGSVVKSFVLPAGLKAVSRDGTTLQSSSYVTSGWYTHFVDTATGGIIKTLNGAGGMEFTNDGSRVFTGDGVIDNPVQDEYAATAMDFLPPVNVVSGSLSSTVAPRDNLWLRLAAFTSSARASLPVEFSADVSTDSVRLVRARMKCKASSAGSWRLTLQLFDHVSGTWSSQARTDSQLTTTPVELTVSSNVDPARYVGPDGRVRLRMLEQSVSIPRRGRPDVSIDYLRFEVVR